MWFQSHRSWSTIQGHGRDGCWKCSNGILYLHFAALTFRPPLAAPAFSVSTVSGSHVHCKSAHISETAQRQVVYYSYYTPTIGNDAWPIETRHFRSPWASFEVTYSLQEAFMRFFMQLHSRWQEISIDNTSRGPSATAELPIIVETRWDCPSWLFCCWRAVLGAGWSDVHAWNSTAFKFAPSTNQRRCGIGTSRNVQLAAITNWCHLLVCTFAISLHGW